MRPPRDVVVVGEAPNRSGESIVRGVGKTAMKLDDLGLGGLRCVNVLRDWPGATGKGSAFPARRPETLAAADRLHRRFPLRTGFLFLGGRAALAYGLRAADTVPLTWVEHRGRPCAVFPHPSGVNHFWNCRRNTARAAAFAEDLVG